MTHHPDERFMRAAIEISARAVEDDVGGPFGAVVVSGQEVIGRGRNRVLADHDPTAHAEILAVREACRSVGDHRLSGCVVYASSEPCPMCMAALYWARVERVFYANVREDAAAIGFDDEWLYQQMEAPVAERALSMTQMLRAEAKAVFDAWHRRPDRKLY